MTAGTFQFVISATDQFSGAFDRLQLQLKSAERDLGRFGRVLGGLGALGAGVSFTGFALLARSALESVAALDDLAEKSGATVEGLSSLERLAGITGASMEGIGAALTKLSRGMATAASDSNEAMRALDFLGISATDAVGALRPADQVLQDVARRMAGFQDGAGKTALAVALFGKSGADMLPVLKDMITLGAQHSAITADQAAAAEHLGNTMRRVGVESAETFKTAVASTVPALQALADGILAALTRTGGLQDGIRQLAADGTLRRWAEETAILLARVADVANVLRLAFLQIPAAFAGVGRDIVVWSEKLPLFNIFERVLGSEDWENKKQFWRDMGAWADSASQSFADVDPSGIEKSVKAMIEAGAVLPDVKNHTEALAGANFRLGEANGKAAQEMERLTKAADSLLGKLVQDYAVATAQASAGTEGLTKAEEELLRLQASSDWAKFPQSVRDGATSLLQAIAAIQKNAAAMKQWDELAKEAAGTAADFFKARQDYIDSFDVEAARIEELARGLGEQLETYGMTEAQVYNLAAARIEDTLAAGRETDPAIVSALERQAQAYRDAGQAAGQLAANRSFAERLKESAESSARWATDFASSFEQAITDALFRAFEAGKDFGEAFKDTLANAFKSLVLKPVIQFIVAPFGAALTGLLMPGSAQAGTGFLTSGLGAAAGNIFTGAGGLFTGLGGNFFGGVGSSLANIGELGLLAGSGGGFSAGLTALGAGNISGGLGSLLGAALPFLGIGLALASASGLFSRDPSQVKGQYRIAGGSGGFEDNAFTGTPFGNIGFGDAGTQYFSGEAAQVFNKAIGDTLAALAERMDAGQIERTSVRLQGLSFQGMEGEYTTEDFLQKFGAPVLQKVIAAAFEELNPALAGLMQAFQGATADEITAYANALLALNDAVAGDVVADIEKVVADSQRTLVDIYRDAGQEVRKLAAAYDGSLDATTRLTTATGAFKQAAAALPSQIEQVSSAMLGQFGSLADARRQLETGGLSAEDLNNYLERESQMLLGQLGAATDPTEIQRLGDRLQQNLLSAFGLLDDTEQAKQRQDYLDSLDDLTKLVSDRLTAVRDILTGDGADSLQAVMATIAGALDAAAQKQQAAADTMVNAASAMTDAAASMPRAFDIRVDLASGAVEVGAA